MKHEPFFWISVTCGIVIMASIIHSAPHTAAHLTLRGDCSLSYYSGNQ